ncbi:FkbM family methyltransferase [Mannheimia pernigra]|uniref:FkbM family methyltransferase n=1 Tax=Mannheimia pernigra TaxID=111844 RepID=UPI0013180C5B|nr:FkbM family methyltransferase [Mannheimia pernigra]QHB18290.1 FkbM family methyltransferase [Mannheimia pernigra]
MQTTHNYDIHGVNFSVIDPDDSIDNETIIGSIYEPTTTTIIRTVLSHSDLEFVDIGSLYGYFTYMASKIVSDRRIFSIEPNINSFTVLEKNKSLNSANNVHLIRCALTDKCGRISFSGRTMKNADLNPNAETVVTLPFDVLKEILHIKKCLVKIDVHGAEGDVLKGMRESLKDGSIQMAIIEIHASHLLGNATHADMLDILYDSGMSVYECKEFRRNQTPSLIEISRGNDCSITMPENWTEEQNKRERMLFAIRGNISEWEEKWGK